VNDSSLDIAYYVHHHGIGHLTRYRAISAASSDRLHPVTELDTDLGSTGLRLPPDCRPGNNTRDPTAHGALHWAPLAPDALAPRLARLATWLEQRRPVGAVVDVSVEAMLSFRLAGLPLIAVRQHGDRSDDAHHLGHRIAERLIAPWPAALENPRTPAWIVDKTDHVGFVVHRLAVGSEPSAEPIAGPDDVVVLWGSGGGSFPVDAVTALAQAAGGATVHLVGHYFDGLDVPDRVRAHGWVDDVEPLLRERPVVVASGGNNTIAVAATTGCPLVVVPQSRPFDEQVAHARRLDDLEAAVVVGDAEDTDWQHAILTARARSDRLAELIGGDGAARAAEAIHRCFR
jgi:UDP-N-acetylglucosamine--N-acetylmuramyl-(pentapeptide) pyrophosphoryl-undecaprenol N-acetylglucosamine transferase